MSEFGGKPDYYSILGVSREASQSQIRSAYRKLAVKYHPDKNIDDAENAAIAFKQLGEAYEVLGDKTKRREYDRGGSSFRSDGGGSAHYDSFARAHDIFNSFFRDFGTEDDDFLKHGGFGGFGTFGHSTTSSRGIPRRGTDDFHRSFMEDNWGTGTSTGGGGRFVPSSIDNMFSAMQSRVRMDGAGTRDTNRVLSSGLRAPGFDMGSMMTGSSRSVTTTTRIVNGRRITKTTERIVNPDGSVETTSNESVEDDTTGSGVGFLSNEDMDMMGGGGHIGRGGRGGGYLRY